MIRIAYLCCGLNRVENIKRLKDSHDPETSDLFITLSHDHARHFDFEDYIPLSHELSTVDRYNQLWNRVKQLGHTHYAFIGDDCEFSKDYNKQLEEAIKEVEKIIPDKKYCIFPNDGIHGYKLATHPVFSKEWTEALGYFFPTGYMRHCFVDNYITDLGASTNRLAYTELELKHHNPFSKKYPAKIDEWQSKVYEPSFFDQDKELYLKLCKEQMQTDIEKLGKLENI